MKIYELKNGQKLKVGEGEPEIRYLTSPYNWKDGEAEMIEVEYSISGSKNRSYYGFVAELFHNKILQDVQASPSKLIRMTQ